MHPTLGNRLRREQRVEVAGPTTQRVDDLGLAPVLLVDRLERAVGEAEAAFGGVPHEVGVEDL